jgi:hypothetical protein
MNLMVQIHTVKDLANIDWLALSRHIVIRISQILFRYEKPAANQETLSVLSDNPQSPLRRRAAISAIKSSKDRAWLLPS